MNNAQDLIWNSKAMKKTIKEVNECLSTDRTILLTGETGTGKTWLAKVIHNAGDRRKKPYIHLECTTISDSLMEAELFGVEKNVATDVGASDGIVLKANQGTLLLDEIAEIPLFLQSKLLKLVDAKKFRKVGGNRDLDVNVRIIAATNKNLKESIANGTFRDDLYYRITPHFICLPPLRERREDILLLVERSLEELSKEHKKSIEELTPDAHDYLKDQDWPGNIRMLLQTVESAIIKSPEGEKSLKRDILEEVLKQTPSVSWNGSTEQSGKELSTSKNFFEKNLFEDKFNSPVTIFEYSVTIFCLLCSQDKNLNLTEITEWVERDRNYQKFVNDAKAEIISWTFSNRNELVTKMTEVVDHTVEYLSGLLSAPVPTPVSINGQTFDRILAAVCKLFLKEYNRSEKAAATALGISPKKFKDTIKQSKPTDPKTDSPNPDERKLNPFPTEEVIHLLKEKTMSNFLGYPVSSQRLNSLDVGERLRAARLALSVLSSRLKGETGSLCVGGMAHTDIESGIYRRATYLYDNQQIPNVLDKSPQTVRGKLNGCGISDFPSQHTLF
jgi:transcriptional regulator with AAA-type ATPase domain